MDELRRSGAAVLLSQAGVPAGNLKAGNGGEVGLIGASSWSGNMEFRRWWLLQEASDDCVAAVKFPLSLGGFFLGSRAINEDPGRCSISSLGYE